jgi:hypothetical protein
LGHGKLLGWILPSNNPDGPLTFTELHWEYTSQARISRMGTNFPDFLREIRAIRGKARSR